MKLSVLTKALIGAKIAGSLECEIKDLVYDSRMVTNGCLFFATRGEKFDGHHFIEQAVEKGAVAVVSEIPYQTGKATIIQVENSRAVMAKLAVIFYRNPSCRMKTAGITGTNGKTTTAFLVKHILQHAMQQPALIGTIRYEIGDRILPAIRTTPESIDMQRLLNEASSSGCRSAVMEMSSHALMQHRASGLEFDAGVFTNLTQDHLDYHRTMDEYFAAKERLFTSIVAQTKKKGKAVINADDKYGQRLVKSLKGKLDVITFGMGANCDLRAAEVRIERTGTTYELGAAGGRKFLVKMPLIGRFNVYNSLAALSAASAMGVDLRLAVRALKDAPQVPGRLEAVSASRNFSVYVDYAHTPDALTNVLKTLASIRPNRLIVVFGCGGDRDKAKRAPMGAAVEEFADIAIVTSDNPRAETPESIIHDVLKGFRSKNYLAITDRKEAIFKAIELAGERDIVLIAGKGHENYQEVDGQKFPFYDAEVAGWALMEKPADFTRN